MTAWVRQAMCAGISKEGTCMRKFCYLPMTLAMISLVFAAGTSDNLAQSILSKTDVRVGVCERPRLGDGNLAVALAAAGLTLVNGLAADVKAVDVARALMAEAGRLGTRVMTRTGVPSALPLADCLADLAVVADAIDANLEGLARAELAGKSSVALWSDKVSKPVASANGSRLLTTQPPWLLRPIGAE